MTDDELTIIERLMKSAGLVQVFNGVNWVDMRDVVSDLCRYVRETRSMNEALAEKNDLLAAEYERALTQVDEAHAEVAMLGQLLREGR